MEPKILEPNEAVAKGAAIHAVDVYINNRQSISRWEDKSDTKTVEPPIENKEDYKEELTVNQTMISISGKTPKTVFATTKSYALELLVPDETSGRKTPKCVNLIFKNESMPDGSISESIQVGTEIAGQETAELVVYENDFPKDKLYFDVDDKFVLGTATLELPPNLPENAPIEVSFTLNSQGLLEVTGLDKTGGKKVQATMQAKGIMAADKVNELKEKSKRITVM
jgi:molecular chaperone DnaK (HSP70)